MFALLFLPLFFSGIAGLFLRNVNQNYSAYLTTFGVFVAFLVSVYAFYLSGFKGEILNIELFTFIKLSGFTSKWAIYIDALTGIMLVVVCFVSLLVHIYSIGYMHDDENLPKFMSFLSLFTFFMLLLVTAKDFIQLFVGWEGVGLCSYLLIGFWNEKLSANKAAIKAFVTNRVGDLALILGICGIYYLFGSLEFEVIRKALTSASTTFLLFGTEVSYITVIAVLLFIGCMGKSAQLFLHVWLPDAMEGPTPVSALIHAATMVTAGVFLLSRASFIFEYSQFARDFIVIVGTITAFFAATIALTQNDIKKIIAYSTCSQLGYMFVASGFSAYNAGIFHLATHAFFKALLFLSAGSVIHAVSGEQDINKMGGLAKKIPVTYVCMLIGSIAIAGIPPLSGFFSKDAILEVAFMKESPLAMPSFVILLLTAMMTTFYSWRLLILVFNGQSNSSQEVQQHIHESPKSMLIPLILLSVFAIAAGQFFEYVLHILNSQTGLFAKAITILPQNEVLNKIHDTPLLIKFLPTIFSCLIIAFAYWFFLKKMPNPTPQFIKTFVGNKYYIDELYEVIFVKPTNKISEFLIKSFDRGVVDEIFAQIPTKVSYAFSGIANKTQNGQITQYFIFIFIPIIGLFYFVILKAGYIFF